MAADTHIKFDGVEGEATHIDHKGEVEVLSWSWNVSNAANLGKAGMGQGKAEAGEFSLMHQYDKSSPVLAKKCATGTHFKEVTVTSRKAGEGQKDFLKIIMKEVFVTAVAPSGSSGGEIMESVTLAYGSIDFSYKPQDEKGGLGGEVKFGFDVRTTKVT